MTACCQRRIERGSRSDDRRPCTRPCSTRSPTGRSATPPPTSTTGEWQKAARPLPRGHRRRHRRAVTTMGGVRIVPDVTLAELDPRRRAMLILPGADTWMTARNGAFVGQGRRVPRRGRPGRRDLRGHGRARRRRAARRPAATPATPPSSWQAVGYGGADHYVDEPAVTDGDLITGSGTRRSSSPARCFARLDLYEPRRPGRLVQALRPATTRPASTS